MAEAEDKAEESTPEQEEGVEYSIVVHHHLDEGEEESRLDTIERTQIMEAALKKAEGLSYTGEYHKVEVKKLFKDKENDREVEMTLKLYEGALKKPASLKEVLLVVVLCGILAFLVSFFGIKYYDLQQKKADQELLEASLLAHEEKMAQEAEEAAKRAAEEAAKPKQEEPEPEARDKEPFTDLF